MADANQLKIEARRKEASGDYAAASRLYQRALEAMELDDSLPDPSLLVRVADLEYRQEDADSALSYYRRAVEDYAEQGLITNAIAVCNKILRVFPEQIACYRRLADLHMDVGLVAEARQNMLRYVDRAREEGATDPAIEAMEELLARSPDQEIALKLATTLARLDREEDALEVLERVWRERTKADADAEALERKARELDPGLDLDDWLPSSEEEAEEPGLAGAESFVSGDAGEDGEDEEDDEDEPARSPLDELAAAAEGLAGPGGFGGGDDVSSEVEAADAADEPPEPRADDADAAEEADEATPAAAGARNGDGPGPDRDGGPPADAWEPMSYGAVDDLEGAEPETEGAAGPSGVGEREGGDRPADSADVGPDDDEGPGDDVAAGEPATIANRLEASVAEARELELVASFPERFTEMTTTRPSNGTFPGPAASSEDSWEERAMDELDELAELEARAEEVTTANEASRAGSPDGSFGGDASGGSREGGGSTGYEPGRGGPETTDPPTSEGESGAGGGAGYPERREPEGPGGGPGSRPDGPRSRAGGSEENLGEEEELRRGLRLLDDLLEVDPDNAELKERKVRYARRLGDPAELVEAYLELAESMAERGSRRGARLLYSKVLELDEGNDRAEAGLGRLDRGELEQKRQSGKGAGAAEGTPRTPSPEEKEARRNLGMRLWTEFEKAVQEMPWLHAATQTYQATSPEAAPPVEAFEMLAHYLISRDRCREAADILEQAVEVADRSDDEIADALYYLGVAHERLGESQRAAEYFRRLDEVDPEFASVREWLPEDDRAGA